MVVKSCSGQSSELKIETSVFGRRASTREEPEIALESAEDPEIVFESDELCHPTPIQKKKNQCISISINPFSNVRISD